MRPDGRKNDEMRKVTVKTDFISTAEGSTLIEYGNTRVICTATLEERVPPFLRDKKRGWVTAEYGMLPRSTNTRTPRESTSGRVGGRTHEIQRLIGRSLRAVTDMEAIGERTIWVDCDVIQADGGTRTASITGAFIAFACLVQQAMRSGMFERNPIKDYLGSVSVGIVKGEPRLDLCYAEDSEADVDMNVVMTGAGQIVELQGTAEVNPFSRETLFALLTLAEKGIREIIQMQKDIFSLNVVKF